MCNYEYTEHARIRLQKRGIKTHWVEASLEKPDEMLYLEGTELVHFIKRIHDFNSRFLRVIANIKTKKIITAYFDRSLRRKYENQNR